MNAHDTDPVGTRLAAALAARAELLEPDDLAPASPPAVVVPLRRRRTTVAAVAAAGLVAAAAVVAVAVTGDGGPRAEQQGPVATQPATPDRPAPRLVEDGQDVLAEEDVAFVAPGTDVSYEGGASAVVSPDSRTLTVTFPDGTEVSADLVVDEGIPNRLSTGELALGQAGAGYLVRRGDDYADLEVLVPVDADTMVSAPVTGDVPFGTGYTDDGRAYVTWQGFSGLMTRVAVGDPAEDRFDFFRWDVTGPGEGGEGPDATARDLVPVPAGTYCIDFAAGSTAPCGDDPFAGVEPGPELPTESTGPLAEVGEQVTYPGDDGWTAELVRRGDGVALLVDEDTVPLEVDLPGFAAPQLNRTLLRIGSATGWLIEEESGDGTHKAVVSFAGGDLVVNTYDGAVPFGNGFTMTNPMGYYRTFVAADGSGLFTQLQPDSGSRRSLGYSWTLASEDGQFRPTLLGSY